jgi:isopenicillin N synthase-like dioxygenase
VTTAATFTVPCVDLTAEPSAAIVEALIESSCAFITGHGIATDDMVAVSTAFFDLPRDRKAPTRWPGDGLWRGWQPVYEGAADLTGGRVPDLLERFEVSLPGPNGRFDLWPEEPPAFAEVWTRYYRALGDLASRLMQTIAATLDLPVAARPAWTSEHFANLVAINYFELTTPPVPGQMRIRAHTDRGGLTILWADQSPGGLEVMLPHSREWVAVTIPPGAFLVQIGDLLARWTNRLIRPNIHRVVNPPAHVAATSRRLSIPYFHYPRLDTVVAAAPSCVAPARPQAMPGRPPAGRLRPPRPVLARDHVFRRQEDYKGVDNDGVEEVLSGWT